MDPVNAQGNQAPKPTELRTPATLKRLEELAALYDLEIPAGAKEAWKNPNNSPHVWGQLVGSDQQKYRGYYAPRMANDRLVRSEASKASYRRRNDEYRTLVHWGQRKLLLTEIEFLTRYGHLSDTVIYAGAAPGTHTAVLAALFPKHKFHLHSP
jgi:hypothetical protein